MLRLLLLLTPLVLFQAHAQTKLPQTIEKIKPAIVAIGTYDKLAAPKARIAGTGFVIGPQLIATNAHVVDNQHPLDDPFQDQQLVVLQGRGEKVKVRSVHIVANDPQHDLAILKLDKGRFPYSMELSEQTVSEGELFAFTGFPIGGILGLQPVTHRGIVSAITPIAVPARNAKELSPAQLKQMRDPYPVYQLDATAYPGNSGSPLFDPDTGKVIAIINKVLVKSSRESALKTPSAITYAIPVKHLSQLQKQVLNTRE